MGAIGGGGGGSLLSVDFTFLSQDIHGVLIWEHLDLKHATIIADAVPPIKVINKPNCSIVKGVILLINIFIFLI